MKNPFDPGYFEETELSDVGFRSIGKNVRIAKNCTIIGLENIVIGSNVRIDGNVVISASNGALNLGNFIHIGGNSYLGCAGGIWMADFSGLSQGVKIYSATDDYSGISLTNPTIPKKFLNVKVAPVNIGRHVIIGSGSVVLPDVEIREGSSVGALSLVNRNLDEWGIYCGCPIKKLRGRSKILLEHEQKLLSEKRS